MSNNVCDVCGSVDVRRKYCISCAAVVKQARERSRKLRQRSLNRLTCRWCRSDFKHKNWSRRYCSDQCKFALRSSPLHGPEVELIGPPLGPTLADLPPVNGKPSLDEVNRCRFCELAYPRILGIGGFCSSGCKEIGLGRRLPYTDIVFRSCRRCASPFVASVGGRRKWCSVSCERRAAGSHRNAIKRAGRKGGDVFTLREIAERDAWLCHLCGGKVHDRPWNARPTDATLDHLIPVSAGGEHTRVNVRLAHNRCNWERSDSPISFQTVLIA